MSSPGVVKVFEAPLLTRTCRLCSLSSRAHVQAVLQNPAFKANPFAAIREHAGNSLVMIDKQVKA